MSNKQEENINEEKVQDTAENKQDQEEQISSNSTEEKAENATEKAIVSEAEEWESKYKEINDKYVRLYSDFENFRRRTAKERLELAESAGSDLIQELLSVLDDFERALNNEQDDQSLKEGVGLIQHKLNGILKNKGLEPMDSKGKEFDYELHEAITKIPAPSKKEKGKIVDVVEKGYYFKGKVLRYAKVVVGE